MELEICPETVLSLVVSQNCTADGPLLESGQSAVESRVLSRDVVVSGGLTELNYGQSAVWVRTVCSIDLKLSREVVGSGGIAEVCCGQSATEAWTVRQSV